MNVKYMGTSDFQEFSAADFDKAGVQGKKLSFARGASVEVDDAVGEALISKEGTFGDYAFEEVVDEAAEEANQLKGKALDEAVAKAVSEGAEIGSGLTADEKRAALAEFNSLDS